MTTRKRVAGPLDAFAGAMQEIAHVARDGATEGDQINVARRTNIKVAKNSGHDGGDAHALATQVAPINQQGSEKSLMGTDHEATKK